MPHYRNRTTALLLSAALVAVALAAAAFGAADGIFPASTPEAQKAIHWSDNGYFVINGQPTFLSSGEIHYARVPRELWKDRILRAKAMGFNTIQTYVMWNAHEGREGQFDFTGNLDLDAWFSLLQECGMYAVVRPGPYVCAEWEAGGLPAWLCAKPDMKVRVNDPQFLKYADRFEGKVFDIIAKHQIQKGGNVLMAQIENEYPNRWGTDTNPYLDHLRELARSHGLEIPVFNSGLHHGDDPAGNRPFGNRNTPWYTTEFWTGWIGLSGDMNNQKAEQKVRATWKIIGFGGAGYDYYVVHGGTNFGYSKGSEVTASYDYASPIGEAGQLRKVYFPMKRAAMFAQAFTDLLTSSKDAGNLVASNSANLQTFARTSAKGSAVFVADAARYQGGGGNRRGGGAPAPTLEVAKTQLTLADGRKLPSGDKQLTLELGEIRALLVNTPIREKPAAGDPTIEYATTRILTRQTFGGATYFVCYGAPGEESEVKVSGQAQPITLKYPEGDQVQEVPLNAANAKLLVMNTALADRTWLVSLGDAKSLVIGPHFVSADGVIESEASKKTTSIIYSAAGRKELDSSPRLGDERLDLPKLTWKKREGNLETTADDSKWASSPQPKAMEQYDDYPNAWGWYRTTIHRDAAGDVQLKFSNAGDLIRLFVNGQRVAGDKNGGKISLKAGDNELAALCWTDGRPKMYNFTGPTGMTAAKGIWGAVQIDGAEQPNWHFHPGLSNMEETPLIANVTNWKQFLDAPGLAGWTDQPDRPFAANAPTFYRADFTFTAEADLHQTIGLRTTGLRAGSVWINGHNLGPYKNNGNGQGVDMYVPECWLNNGSNTLVIFDAEGAAPDRAALHPLETWATMQMPK